VTHRRHLARSAKFSGESARWTINAAKLSGCAPRRKITDNSKWPFVTNDTPTLRTLASCRFPRRSRLPKQYGERQREHSATINSGWEVTPLTGQSLTTVSSDLFVNSAVNSERFAPAFSVRAQRPYYGACNQGNTDGNYKGNVTGKQARSKGILPAKPQAMLGCRVLCIGRLGSHGH